MNCTLLLPCGCLLDGDDGPLNKTSAIADVFTGAITNADIANMAPAKNGVPSKLSLRVTQIAPGSGSNTNGGVVSFGTYKLEVIDGAGNVVAHGLRQPTHLQLHLGTKPIVYDVSKAFVTINGALPSGTHTAGDTPQLPVSFDQKNNILATDIPADASLQPITPGAGAQTFVPILRLRWDGECHRAE